MILPRNQTDSEILTKLDLLDEDDTKEILGFINTLLDKDKYEGEVKLH